MWSSMICCFVQMWRRNCAVFMKMTPRQCGLWSDPMPAILLEHIHIPQVKVPLHSHQNQNRIQIKAKQTLSLVRRTEKWGSYLHLIVSIEITASTWGKTSSWMICQENQAAFFHKLGNHAKANWTKDSRKYSHASYFQFSHSLLPVLQSSQIPMIQVQNKALTDDYLPTWYVHEWLHKWKIICKIYWIQYQ